MQHNNMRQVLVDFFSSDIVCVISETEQYDIDIGGRWNPWNMDKMKRGRAWNISILRHNHTKESGLHQGQGQHKDQRSDENKVTVFCEVKLLFQLAQDCKLRLIFNSTDGDGLFHQSSSARNELWQPSKILFCKPIALQIVSVLLTLLYRCASIDLKKNSVSSVVFFFSYFFHE